MITNFANTLFKDLAKLLTSDSSYTNTMAENEYATFLNNLFLYAYSTSLLQQQHQQQQTEKHTIATPIENEFRKLSQISSFLDSFNNSTIWFEQDFFQRIFE